MMYIENVFIKWNYYELNRHMSHHLSFKCLCVDIVGPITLNRADQLKNMV